MGQYEFTIYDSYGDGICCTTGVGYYNITMYGLVISQGDDFEDSETALFSLPLPSFPPSESLSPIQTPSLLPSGQPTTSSPPSTYWSTLNWELQNTTLTGRASGDRLGESVSLSDNGMTMAVGTIQDSPEHGYVNIYHREDDNSSWELQDTIYGDTSGDRFGVSLSLSDDGMILAVGAPYNDSNGYEAGQVKMYQWDEAELKYMQLGNPLYYDESFSGYRFGQPITLSGDGRVLAVGAREGGSLTGSVDVYGWDGTVSDYKKLGLSLHGDEASDEFGFHLALSSNGSILAIGARQKGRVGSGYVKVFMRRDIESSYMLRGQSLGGFGSSLALTSDGNSLAVGGIKDSTGSHANIYEWDESTLNYKQKDNLNSKGTVGEFGVSLSWSSDGRTLAISSIQSGGPGEVFVYRWDEDDSVFKQLGRSIQGDGEADELGRSLSLSGDGNTLAMGANQYHSSGIGFVHVYSIEYTIMSVPDEDTPTTAPGV